MGHVVFDWQVRNGKSPGTDEVTAELLKAGGETLARQVHRICAQIWKKEKWPEEWTKTVMVTTTKKGDLMQCQNYRTIALINTMSKVMMMVLLERLKHNVESFVAEEQAGFRRDRSTIQQILTLRLVAEKAHRESQCVYSCFIDFTKAFDISQTRSFLGCVPIVRGQRETGTSAGAGLLSGEVSCQSE